MGAKKKMGLGLNPDYSQGVGVDMEKACFIQVLFEFCGSTVHPRLEINEFAKLVAILGELPQGANQTPVIVNDSG